MAAVSIDARKRGEYAVLQGNGRNIGVLLLDPSTDRLWVRVREDWREQDDEDVFPLLEQDLASKAAEMGGQALLASLEDTLSNALRITARARVAVDAFIRQLDLLFAEHVAPLPVAPFHSHLPLYSLRAAAGNFGAEMPAEAEGWVRVPMRLQKDMFVARVEGRSMEPRIPDGSLNVFRYGVAGSRQGRIVLAELPGAFDETARYTVKRYASRKRALGEDQWEHEAVRLEPLNPEFEPIDLEPGCVMVIAEWLRTLE
ncbi:MAG: helix-turn-helix transcriptional regulator [Bryobacteraceae bacterium]